MRKLLALAFLLCASPALAQVPPFRTVQSSQDPTGPFGLLTNLGGGQELDFINAPTTALDSFRFYQTGTNNVRTLLVDFSPTVATFNTPVAFVGSFALATGKIFIGNAGGNAAQVTPSGDCTIALTGVITCTQSAGNFLVNGSLTVQGVSIDTQGELFTNIAAPATPAAGTTRIYSDSTQKVLTFKNDAGTVGNAVVPSTCGANLFGTSISAAGVFGCTQPAFSNLSGSATLAQMPQLTANSIYINATGSAAQPVSTAVPACANDGDHGLVYINGTGLQCATITGTVSNITPGGGLVSSVTAACSQTAITGSGTLSRADCVNAQSGTTYAIVDGDRAKLITATNAAAQAYSIAQAGTASQFASGWFTDIQNNSTNVAGIITITPTTSQICAQGTCAATFKIQPGQFARITSDGTNYQVSFNPTGNQLPGTATNDAANAGNVGQYVESVIVSGSAISLTSGTSVTITSISLTAGDWDVDTVAAYFPANTTQFTQLSVSLSLTTNTLDTTPGRFFQVPQASITSTGTQQYNAGLPPYRFSLSATTSIFMVVQAGFTVSTMTGFGIIRARRVR